MTLAAEEETKEAEAPKEHEKDVETAKDEESPTENEEFHEAIEVDPTAEQAAEEQLDEEENEENKRKKKYVMKVAADAPWKDRMWEVFSTFWPLGLVAFGGPQAHVAILRDHLVEQRDWLDEDQFTELFAIGQVHNDDANAWPPMNLNRILPCLVSPQTGFARTNEYTARHFDSY